MKTPPGGSATLYGVLYQLLSSVHHAVRLRDLQRRGEAVLGARLIVEPPRGGGDLRIEVPRRRVVEQLKARTTSRPWGLLEIVDSVLPDLYLDPALDVPEDQTEYVFTTEGFAGPKAHAFLERPRGTEPDKYPLAGLSREDRKTFRRLADAVRKRKPVRSESLVCTHRKLRRLLSRFEIREGQTAERLAREIDRMLRPLVDHIDDLEATRGRLCEMILYKGAEGGTELVPEDLLREAGLHGASLEDRDELRRTARELLEREVVRRAKYDRNLDVRRSPEWPQDRRFLVLSGESGQGKTWQISRLALDLGEQENGPIVVFLEAQGEAERDFQKASDLLWTQAWGHDRPISLERLVARWKEIHGEPDQPWLVLCVDGVERMREARALIEGFDWERSGLQLAMTVPLDVGTALAQERPEQVQLRVLRDFILPELREYLRRQGYAWETVPSDVRETLRRPLLARLYTTIGSDPKWTPTREYELYEGYWQWLQRVREQSEHHEDFDRLKRLALTLLGEESQYPWTLEQLETAKFTDEARLRLERAGWWTRNEEGVKVWHDRLLSWVLAEAIAEQGSGDVVADRLMICRRSDRPRIGRILGYVPMDVLWLVSGKPDRQGLVPHLIARLEQADAFGLKGLYENLLPTLGARIFLGLLQRLRTIHTDKSLYIARKAVKTVSEILARNSSVLDRIPKLLQEDGTVREVAIRILARHPSPAAIGHLWEIHKKNAMALEESRNLENHTARQNSFAALRACLDLEPHWLRSKVLSAQPDLDPIWELAYLLANLKHPLARSIWMEVKGELFQKIPPHQQRSLVMCIRIFDDREEVRRLESWLTIEEDWIGDSAFRAIAWVEPDRALDLLRDVSLDNLSNDHSGSWPIVLLAKRPDLTREALRERIASAGSELWRVAELYHWYEEQIDQETLGLLLDRLAQDVKGFSGKSEDAWNHLWRPLQLLARIHRLDLLHVFEERSGTDLDRELGELSASWVDSPGQHDLKEVHLVLLKVGGEGFRRLIRAGFSSRDPDRRWEALAWGMACPEEVAAAAPSEELAFAGLGEDRALVEEILAWTDEIENSELTNLWLLRQWKAPMPDSDIAPALEALASRDARRRIRGLAAVSISGRTDLLTRLPEWLEGLDELESKDLQELDDRAAYFVHRLAEDNSEGVRRLSQNLDPQSFPGALAELLGKPGAKDLSGQLEQHLLQQVKMGRFGAAEMELALALRHHKELDSSLLRAIWEYGKHDLRWNRKAFWTTVARLDSEEIHENVWKKSLDRDSFFDERIGGIAALGLLDPCAAFETAARHLGGTGKERVEFVWLLMELDAKRTVPLLIDQAVGEKQTEVLWTIARVLRRAGPEVETELRARLESPDFRVRTVAIHLAGWQGPGFLEAELQRLAEGDPDRDIQWECLWALARQRKELCVLELIDAFRRAEGIARWSYLEAILELGDPRLLVTKDDSLWLGRILTPELGVLEVHANSRLKERFDDVKRKAEQRDRDNED